MELHHVSCQEAVRLLETDGARGLSRAQAAQRQAKWGKNQLREDRGPGLARRFFRQFQDFMVLILLGAAGVSYLVSRLRGEGEYLDSLIILAIVTANACIGTFQEWRADKAIAALRKLSSPHATVVREGKRQVVDSAQLVPGDLVILQAGDLVPADLRLLKSVDLQTEESALTGESLPVEKDAQTLCGKQAPLGERKNTAFAFTAVTAGAGAGVVAATGMDTAVGKIAGMIAREEAPQTPLQERLKETGKLLGLGVLAVCGVIFLLGLLQHRDPLEMFLMAVSLGVAAIPEGLTAVVTIVLAMGVSRLAKQRAIVRHMPAVETLGSTGVICSDKTGTLTQNRMTAAAFSGSRGRGSLDSREAQFALELASLCSNAEAGERGEILGDPTEAAFLRACREGKAHLERLAPRVGEIPFSSQRKRMTTVHSLGQGRYRVISKGAPDVLLARCTSCLGEQGPVPLGPGRRAQILGENSALAGEALRVLAVAYRDREGLPREDRDLENGLVFAGLIGLEDPPRPGVKEAVAQCRRAGITPVMITGDHAATALAIARRVGIAGPGDRALTGEDLDRMDEAALARALPGTKVFARVSPAHKVLLVKACQRQGLVAAMTGDGVNDAPALKAADIGCAMGKNGTEVAKSAADMVLTDDDFSTIVSAVREGRGIYRNIRKTIHFLLSCNMGEVLVVLLAFLLDLPAPLLPIQLLWVNLVTDSLPALALGADPMEEDVMEEPPHPKGEGIFSGGMGFSVAVEGCLVGALAFLAYTLGRVWFDGPGPEPVVGRTMAFCVLSLSQLVHSFNMRSRRPVLRLGLFSNRKLTAACAFCAFLMVSVVVFPPLAALFQTAALTGFQWLLVAALSLCPLLVVEGEKLLWERLFRKKKKERR